MRGAERDNSSVKLLHNKPIRPEFYSNKALPMIGRATASVPLPTNASLKLKPRSVKVSVIVRRDKEKEAAVEDLPGGEVKELQLKPTPAEAFLSPTLATVSLSPTFTSAPLSHTAASASLSPTPAVSMMSPTPAVTVMSPTSAVAALSPTPASASSFSPAPPVASPLSLGPGSPFVFSLSAQSNEVKKIENLIMRSIIIEITF